MLVSLIYTYILHYILVINSIFFLCFSFSNLQFLNSLSLTNYIYFYKKYNTNPILFFFSIFLLTGIPPSIFFLLKFSFLCNIFFKINFGLSFLIFLLFLINMFFYSQIFIFKNYLNSTLLNIYSKNLISNKGMFKTISYFSSIYFILYFLSLSVCSIFFFTDLLLLVYVHN